LVFVRLTKSNLFPYTTLFRSVRRERLRRRKAETAALLGEHLDPELVVAVRPLDGHPQPPGQFGDAAGVIDVAMGDQDHAGGVAEDRKSTRLNSSHVKYWKAVI